MSFKAKGSPSSTKAPRISDAEWEIMKVVWRLEAPSAKRVVEALAGDMEWKPKTIHTLLSRLVQKGALASEKPGKEYIFKPLFTEQQCRLAASRSFLEKVFDGEIAPFLACFLEREKLSRKEINELKALLEGKSK